MEFEIEYNEMPYTLTIDWATEEIINDYGNPQWIVTGYWVTEVNGRRIGKDEEKEWRSYLNAEDVENEILDYEAGL